MITNIRIQDNKYTFNGTSDLGSLSKVNIFLGSNNSGKSRFLRGILTKNLYFQNTDFLELKEKFDNLITYINQDPYRKGLLANHLQNNGLNLGDYLKENEEYEEKFNKVYKFVSNGQESHGWSGTSKTHKTVGLEVKKYIDLNLDSSKLSKYSFKKVYIPMLRGLRGYEEYTKDGTNGIYDLRTIKDYFSTENSRDGDFVIFTGLDLYEDIKNMLLGSLEKRELVYEFEEYLSDNFFEGEEISLIPRVESDVLFIKIGEQEERAIYDLGDGLQSIIINTFPLFKYKGEYLLMFIEEPEMTMHPGMQRKLMNVFCQQDNAQFFITTHSNHLLDISFDYENEISTFSCKKAGESEFLIDNKTKNKEILDILGIRNSSVFLSNCVIWVEGISDRLLIKKFLELYYLQYPNIEKFDEDKHFSILEYGGGNITHFNFEEDDRKEAINVNSIQKNNFMIADNDGNWDGNKFEDNEKGKRLRGLKEIFGEKIFFDHREIENILGKELFNKYCKKFLSNSDETGKKIKYEARDLENIDWKTGRIGDILKEHFISPIDIGVEPEYFSKNHDIKVLGVSKTEFSRQIIDLIDSENIQFEDLEELAKKMIENIYDFIKLSNQ